MERIEQVSAEVRRLLLKLTPELVATAEGFCKQVIYVPVSALGQGPEIQKESGLLGIRPRNIRPQWVTVPFLYILARWSSGLIAVSRRSGQNVPAKQRME